MHSLFPHLRPNSHVQIAASISCPFHQNFWVEKRVKKCFLIPAVMSRVCPMCEAREAADVFAAELQRRADAHSRVTLDLNDTFLHSETTADLRRAASDEVIAEHLERIRPAVEAEIRAQLVAEREALTALAYEEAIALTPPMVSFTNHRIPSLEGCTSMVVDDGGSLYIGHQGGVTKFNAAKKLVGTLFTLAPISGNEPNLFLGIQALAWCSVRRELYVSDARSHRVSVLSTSTGAVLRRIGSGMGCHDGFLNNAKGLALSPDGSELYVGDTENARVSVFDAPSGRFCRTLATGGELWSPSHLVISSDGRTLFVLDPEEASVLVLDAVLGAVIRKFGPFDRPRGLALSVRGGLLLLACRGSIVLVSARDGAALAKWTEAEVGSCLADDGVLVAAGGNGHIVTMADWGRAELVCASVQPPRLVGVANNVMHPSAARPLDEVTISINRTRSSGGSDFEQDLSQIE